MHVRRKIALIIKVSIDDRRSKHNGIPPLKTNMFMRSSSNICENDSLLVTKRNCENDLLVQNSCIDICT